MQIWSFILLLDRRFSMCNITKKDFGIVSKETLELKSNAEQGDSLNKTLESTMALFKDVGLNRPSVKQEYIKRISRLLKLLLLHLQALRVSSQGQENS